MKFCFAPGNGKKMISQSSPIKRAVNREAVRETGENWHYGMGKTGELGELIGLYEVKTIILEIVAYLNVQQLRMKHGLKADNLNLHMVFSGNPGTGKSAVARALGGIMERETGPGKGSVVEVERADLVGEYIGHTAQKTRTQIEKARGGILFVDEAYSLGRGDGRDFGKEAIDVIVKAMEDYRGDFILILAGYPEEMDSFLNLNPGMRSRISIHVDFPDFTVNELLRIADKMSEDYQYRFTPEAKNLLRTHLLKLNREGKLSDGNARIVRNLLEKSIRKQAFRLVNSHDCSLEKLMLLQPEDMAC